jgi:hypothetical protein
VGKSGMPLSAFLCLLSHKGLAAALGEATAANLILKPLEKRLITFDIARYTSATGKAPAYHGFHR